MYYVYLPSLTVKYYTVGSTTALHVCKYNIIYMRLKKRHDNATEFIVLYIGATILLLQVYYFITVTMKWSFQIFKTLDTEII